MKFHRLFTVEFLYRGIVSSSDASLDQKARIEKVREYFAQDKPDVIIDSITEEKGLAATEENDFVYKIKGFSQNPNIR